MIPTAQYNSILSNIQLLPEQVQEQVADYVQYLVIKYYSASQSNTEKVNDLKFFPYRKFGVFKGKIKLSTDFNEPIDDFKEY